MDTEPDETIIMPEGAVQRWDRPEGMTFRLDVWGEDGTTEPASGHTPGDDNDRGDALESNG